jgi:hypothetical protein
MTVAAEPRTYHLVRPDSLGFFKRRSGRQFAIGSCGVALGLVAIAAHRLAPGVRVGFASFGTLVMALAAARTLGGEDVIDLLAPVARFSFRRLSHQHRFVAPLVPATGLPGSAVPPAFAGLALFDIDPMAALSRAGSRVGVVHDRGDGTVSLTLRVHGDGFLVAAPDEQDYRLSAWGQALAQFCREGHPVVRVAWSHWLAPAGIEEHRAWLEQSYRDEPNEQMRAAYDEVLSIAGRSATRSEVLVTISVAQARTKLLPHHDGDRLLGAIERLLEEADLFAGQLQRGGLVVSRPLPAGALARTLRDRLDPSAMRRLDLRGRSLGELSGIVTADNGFPLVTEESRTTMRTDDAFHRTYRIAEWPRVGVRADWMAGFLCMPDVVRACTVIFLPESRRVARRHANALATKVGATIDEKQDHGRRVGAEERRAQAAVDALDEELESGAGMELFVGLVDVTAGSEESLEAGCEQILQAAANAHLELRRLDFRHGEALVCALPLGRGPKRAAQ